MAHTSVPSSSATAPHVVSFRSLPDLACSNVGGRVLSVTDEFFAKCERMLSPEAPIFVVGKFDENGKWMDGWESRRKRVAGYDHCVIGLGTPGKIAGFTVDTSFFVGNFPESCSIEATSVASDADINANTKWVELVPKSALAGGTANYFGVTSQAGANERFTHLRFNIFPDGGIARLRVHGTVMPDWPALIAVSKAAPVKQGTAYGGLVDVCSVLNGAKVITSNDAFFGSHSNLILPNRAPTMGDGWETRRKRVLPGFDWIIVELGCAAKISRIEVDTNHFKGNFPDSTIIEACYIAPERAAHLQPLDWHRPNDFEFVELLPQTKLQASHQLFLEKEQLTNTDKVVTHVRMKIFPDGGISRLRMWGEPQL